MRLFILSFLLSFFVASCQKQVPQVFSESALADIFLDKEGSEIPLKKILDQQKGSVIFIAFWASWCKDCLESIPSIEQLKKTHPEVSFIYLSLDKSEKKWLRALDRYPLIGTHYYMKSGWKGTTGKFIDLDWIPRYMVLDKDGFIRIFNSTDTQNIKLLNALK